jgi:hypothetical protein
MQLAQASNRSALAPGSLARQALRQVWSAGWQVHCQQKRMSWQPKSFRQAL